MVHYNIIASWSATLVQMELEKMLWKHNTLHKTILQTKSWSSKFEEAIVPRENVTCEMHKIFNARFQQWKIDRYNIASYTKLTSIATPILSIIMEMLTDSPNGDLTSTSSKGTGVILQTCKMNTQPLTTCQNYAHVSIKIDLVGIQVRGLSHNYYYLVQGNFFKTQIIFSVCPQSLHMMFGTWSWIWLKL